MKDRRGIGRKADYRPLSRWESGMEAMQGEKIKENSRRNVSVFPMMYGSLGPVSDTSLSNLDMETWSCDKEDERMQEGNRKSRRFNAPGLVLLLLPLEALVIYPCSGQYLCIERVV
jgi:hypothetical protein